MVTEPPARSQYPRTSESRPAAPNTRLMREKPRDGGGDIEVEVERGLAMSNANTPSGRIKGGQGT